MGKINELEKEAAGMEQKVEKKLFSVVVMKSLNITFSIAMAVMFIFSLVFIENVHPYFMSSFIYLLFSIIFALTAYFYKEHHPDERLYWIMPGGRVILAGWVMVFLMLIIRLTSFQLYNSSIFSFDFGPKNCYETNGFDNKLNKTKSILKCEEIHQYSFTFDDAKDAFNTLGHTFQGFLCICMFCQARFYITNFMVKILHKLFHKDLVPNNNTIDNNKTMQTPRNNQFFTQSEIYFIKISRMFDIFLLIVWVYPFYNAMKRIIKSADTFSTSSYGNNSFEWAIGFLFGLSIGFLIEIHGRNVHDHKILSKNHQHLKSTFSTATLKSYGSDVLLKALKTTDSKIAHFEHRWYLARVASGILLIIASIVAIMFYIMTWGSSIEDNETVTDSNVNSLSEALATVSLICVFLPCFSCFFIPLCTKHEIIHRQTSLLSFSTNLEDFDDVGSRNSAVVLKDGEEISIEFGRK